MFDSEYIIRHTCSYMPPENRIFPCKGCEEEQILRMAIGGKKLALENNTWEAPRGQGPSPGDFGEHEPIPEDAMTSVNLMVTGKQWRPALTSVKKVENNDE